jgi:hypothetical protein
VDAEVSAAMFARIMTQTRDCITCAHTRSEQNPLPISNIKPCICQVPDIVRDKRQQYIRGMSRDADRRHATIDTRPEHTRLRGWACAYRNRAD